MSNAINWFEIPARNFDEAKSFYGKILNTELHVENIMGIQMAMLPYSEDGVGGAICTGEGYAPTTDGTLPYLNGGNDLQDILSRVESAGGQIIMPKTKISDEVGHVAVFHDTEGNRIGLHSPN